MSDDERATAPRLTLDLIRTPYDEDEIAGLVTALYELLIKLAYLGRDQGTWPLPDGHAERINEALCREQLQMAPQVVALMKRLPYVDGDLRHSVDLFPRSEPLSYLQDADVACSRDPEGTPRRARLRRDYILPHDIPLPALDDEGPYLHAPSFFRRFLDKMETLDVIPSGCEQFERQYYGPERPEICDPARRVLIETYGWPDGFRQADWARDAEEVWDGIIRRALD